jgi:hypothetical protein
VLIQLDGGETLEIDAKVLLWQFGTTGFERVVGVWQIEDVLDNKTYRPVFERVEDEEVTLTSEKDL